MKAAKWAAGASGRPLERHSKAAELERRGIKLDQWNRTATRGYFRPTVGISRADLTRDCIQQLRMWPGCEAVEGIAVLAIADGRFTVHVVDYGSAKKRLSDRAVRCIQREQQRHYHLK
jgi:hypothetical protein